ncbi:MFS transporter [Pontibacillus yanchengensis]|uniref:MFS transporter n=1 Tax=Pontibacillus yanchengensis Y32 TaxID=1385514 RepID=A0A0A2TPI3_9BACI|nr:MFS transporter [Pontibacillus yanchengensis]KGP71240.1 MFS transporter [Pontibacillus yanchengensis Y32]
MQTPTTKVHANNEYPKLRKNTQVLRFIAGNLVSFFGDQIYLIALPLIVLELTNSPLSMGIVAGLERLPVLIQPLCGVVADRWDRKRILLSCDFIRFLVIGMMGVLFLTNALHIEVVCLGALLVGGLTQLYNTSQFASVPRLVPRKDLQLVNSLNTGMLNMAVFIAPGLGGLIISVYNPGIALILNSISFLIGFFVVLSLKIIPMKKPNHSRFLNEIKEGFQFVWKNKPIMITNVAMLFSIVGTTLFLTMMVVHLKTSVYLDALQIGWVLSVGGLGAIGGALLSNPLKKVLSYRAILFLAGTVGGASIILFSFVQTTILLASMNAIGTMCAAIMSPSIVTIRQHLTPERLLGRVQATSRFMTWLLMPITALLAGVFAEYMGTSITIGVGGAISTLASFIYLHQSLKVVSS